MLVSLALLGTLTTGAADGTQITETCMAYQKGSVAVWNDFAAAVGNSEIFTGQAV